MRQLRAQHFVLIRDDPPFMVAIGVQGHVQATLSVPASRSLFLPCPELWQCLSLCAGITGCTPPSPSLARFQPKSACAGSNTLGIVLGVVCGILGALLLVAGILIGFLLARRRRRSKVRCGIALKYVDRHTGRTYLPV